MAQHDYDIANTDGATVRADINSVLEAVATLNSGSTAPSTTFANQWWADTSAGILKRRNSANNAWISVIALTDTAQPYDAALASLAGLSLVSGDVLYATAADTLARLAKGTDGQVLKLASGVPSWANTPALTLGTASTATGGTSIDFTGLPSGIKRITVTCASMSTTGASPLQIQLGDSGGIETTGYVGSAADDAGTLRTSFSSGLLVSPTIGSGTSANFTAILTVLDGNTWSFSCEMGRDDAAKMYHSAGTKALSAVLDRLRFTTTGGSDTFDANGGINIMYEV